MAAIISDKFRIFNAKQFLESLTEGPNDTSAERSRMYFFVGRPQPWKAYLEIHTKNSTAFSVERSICRYIWINCFSCHSSAVYDNALFLPTFLEVSGVNSAPPLGSALKGRTGGSGGSDTGATAVRCLSLCN